MAENEAISKAKENYDKLSEDEETQWLAEKRELFLCTREQTYNNGVKYGIEQGKRLEVLKIAKKLLEKGADIEEIIEVTGLNKEEIEDLKNK